MFKILKMRPLYLKDLQYARLLKPFEDANLVDVIDESENLEFLIRLVNDKFEDSKDYIHVLTKTHDNMLPSEIYEHLVKRDDYIPTLYSAYVKDGKYSRIQKITRYQDLQAAIARSQSRGDIEDSTKLLRSERGDTYEAY